MPLTTNATVVALLLVALGTAGCNSNVPAAVTTTPSTTSTRSTEYFIGTLAVGDSQFYSFSVATDGVTSITLASLTASKPGPAANVALSLSIGTPAGTGCTVSSTVTVGPALTSQIAQVLTPGIYCAQLADPGSVKAPLNFVVRMVHP